MSFARKTIAAAVAASMLLSGAAFADVMVGGMAMYPTKNIIENAVNSADHTTLVAAVKAAGLVDTLQGKGPFTVFAPVNAAFAALPAGTVDTLLKPENKPRLVAILTYHVLAGKVMAADALKLDGKPAKTLNGQDISVSVKDGNVLLNGAKVLIADVPASNGVIHAIDTVLLPQ